MEMNFDGSSIKKYDYPEALAQIYLDMEIAANLDPDILRGISERLRISAEQLKNDPSLHQGQFS